MFRQSGPEGRRQAGAGRVGLVLTTILTLTATVHADNTEVRDYSVHVSGKRVGYNQIVITDKQDGTTAITNRANVQVKVLLVPFTFSYNGTEVWRKYQLLRLDGVGKENRKTVQVNAVYDATSRQIRLTANNRTQMAPGNLWTSTFWRLPKVTQKAHSVPTLKSSHGTVNNCQLTFVGNENRPIMGRPQKCYHFRITGGKKPIDLWFDVQHRLVREEFVEMGKRCVIEMVNLRRTAPPTARKATTVGRSQKGN